MSNSADKPLERLPSGIFSALPLEQRDAEYDRLARIYDLVVGNGLYNRVVWGCPKSAYFDVATRLLRQNDSERILDFGCGSLVFTAPAYRGHEDRLTLFDRSIGMLERGQARLPTGRFVQGDAFDPPFAEESFAAAMSWGTLHLFGTGSDYLAQLRKLIRPGGSVALGTLTLSGRPRGDRMLAMLHRKGEAATPQTAAEVTSAFETHFASVSATQHGNMLFLSGRRPID